MDILTLAMAKGYTDEKQKELLEALPEDTTATGVEVADIRKGYTGTVYKTAGEAVRGQVADLHSDINSIASALESGVPVPVALNFTTKKYLKKTTGEEISGSNALLGITDYINIPIGCKTLYTNCYYAEGVTATTVFYDADKSILKDGVIDGSVDGVEITIPVGSVYVRFCNYAINDHAHESRTVSFVLGARLTQCEEAVSKIGREVYTELSAVNDNNKTAIVFTDTGSYTNRDGEYVHNNNQTLAVSDYIEIPRHTQKIVTNAPPLISVISVLTFYDSEKTLISALLEAETENIPENAVYLRVCSYDTASVHEGIYVVFTEFKRICDLERDVELLKSSLVDWSEKKWTTIGDSITYGEPASSKTYHEYIAELTGVTVNNISHSGTGYMRGVQGFRYQSQNAGTDSDLITIFGGINDCAFDSNYVIGEATDTTETTICGCINITLDNIEALYPYAPLGIISPIPAKLDSSFEAQLPDQYPLVQGCRAEILTEKLKEICAIRGYPFLDLFHTSGLRPWDDTCSNLYFKRDSWDHGDGLHPNALGHGLIYKKIYDFIRGIIL